MIRQRRRRCLMAGQSAGLYRTTIKVGKMEEPRTCFVISPIGEKDSEIRKHADNIIKRVIMPSLSGLNFQTIRVDLSFANSRISDEIVTLIKNSELCIVDSSGHNPNVMYELGRRHQTGKPVILM